MAARGENVLFLPQNLDIWGQKSIFCLVIAIFVDGANKEVKRGEKLLTVLREIPLTFSVVEKLLLELLIFVCEVRETFSKRVLLK